MELNKIQSIGSWGKTADYLNQNFSKVSNAVEQVKNATTRNKGYYALTGASDDNLIAQIVALGLKPTVGDKVYVGTEYPYKEFQYTDDGWVKTSDEAGAEQVSLGDYYTKQEVNTIFLGWQDELETAVRTTPQVLTEEEQAVARNNISALGITDLDTIENKIGVIESNVQKHTESINTIENNISTIDNNIADIESDILEHTESIGTIENNIAELRDNTGLSEYKEYSESENYVAGDLRVFNGLLYECIEGTTGVWDSTKWKPTSFKKEMGKKLSELGQQVGVLSSSNTYINSLSKETISGGMSNMILLADGNESVFSGFNISPYIEVVKSKDYYMKTQGVSSNYASLILYDKNKEILRIFKGGEIYSGVWCHLSLPFAVKYIRISYSNIDNYVYSRARVESLADVKELALVASINKFNKDDVDVQIGKYINSSGAVANNTECFVTGFIPIKNGQTFRINSTFGTGARIQLYDAYKAPISNENYPTTNEEVTGTSESKYVRFTARLTDFDNVMIVEGNMPSVYVPFSNSSVYESYDIYKKQLIEQVDVPLSSSLIPIETTFTEGTFQDSTQGFYVSDYIKITQENKTYYYKSSVKINASYKKVIFYDKDYNEIAFINGQGFTTNTVVKLRFPRGAEYIRYCTVYMKHELFQAEVLDFEKSVKGMIDGKFNETNFTDLVKLWGEVNDYETGDGYVNVQTGELVFGDFEYHRKYVVPAGTRSRVVLNNGAGIYAAALVDENNTIIDSFIYANEKSGKEFSAQEKETYLYVSTYKLVRVDYQTKDLESLNQRVEDLEDGISTIDNNKVLWIGTSIPEGATYPRIACERNGYSCTNKSLGSSMLRFTGMHPSTVQYWSGRCLTATVEELEALYRDDVTNGTITESRLNEWKNYSYERSIVPYIDGTNETQVAMIVIDHGFNDRTNIKDSIANEGSIDWSSRDRSNFVGAFNYLIDRIFEINPFIKIVVAGYFQNKYAPYYSEQICRMQQLVAEHYGFALMDAWNYTQINDLFVPNTANYIADFNAKYGTSYDKLAQDDSGNILSLQLYCPDHVHPHSDKTGNCDKRLDAVYTKLLRSSL